MIACTTQSFDSNSRHVPKCETKIISKIMIWFLSLAH